MELAERFLRLVGGSGSLPPAEMEEALRTVVRSARTAWPEVDIADHAFVEFLAGKVAGTGDWSALLLTLHTSDLYLACGCLHGDPKAIAAIERCYVSQLAAHTLHLESASGLLEELRQTLRERVLVARNGEPPRISSYNGRGPLGAWLGMVAARLAIDLRKKQHGAAPLPDLSNQAMPGLDVELHYLKERYRVAFEQAIQEAFRELSARDSTLLRLHYLESVPVSSIALMYRVSTRTVQRWIAAAQASIKAGVRRRLAAKFDLSEQELDSLLGLVISQLSVTLQKL